MENTKSLTVKELVEQLLKVDQNLPVNVSSFGFGKNDGWDAPLELGESTLDVLGGICRINFSSTSKIEKEKPFPKEISKEELFKYEHYLTVGKIKEFLNKYDLSDDSMVVVQRIEDFYYENNGWSVYLKEGESYWHCERWNEDIKGDYLDTKKYPRLVGKELKLFTEEQMKQSMCQYSPIWSCVRYNDDKDILFLDLHY